MASVAVPTETRNPKAYHAQYLGLRGVLVKPAAQVLFLEPSSGAVITLTAEEVLRDVVINGEVGTSMQQFISDQLAGGAAAVACGRTMGRA